MGTAFAAASRETGGELQLMSRMGYDATTFGNHEFDLGPDGLGKSIGVAAKAGRVPAVLASNTNFYEERRHAGRSPAPGQGRGDPPLPRDRTRRHSLRHLRGARQRGPDLHQWRRGFVLRPHRDRQGDGEDSPRDGEGGCGHRSQPRRRGEREGRALHRRRGRAPGQGRAGHRRGDRRPQPHRAARGDHRQRPHARGPDREAKQRTSANWWSPWTAAS